MATNVSHNAGAVGGIANRFVLVDVISVDSAVVFVTATLITTSAVCAWIRCRSTDMRLLKTAFVVIRAFCSEPRINDF